MIASNCILSMYSFPLFHHGEAYGKFPHARFNIVAANVSSNHGSHAFIPIVDVVDGIHEDVWYPATNTRSYEDQSLHPLEHEADGELTSYINPPETTPYKHVPFTANALAQGKAHCDTTLHSSDGRRSNKKFPIQRRKKSTSWNRDKFPRRGPKQTVFNSKPIGLMNLDEFEKSICKQLEIDVLPLLDSYEKPEPKTRKRRDFCGSALRRTLNKSLHSILDNTDPIDFLKSPPFTPSITNELSVRRRGMISSIFVSCRMS